MQVLRLQYVYQSDLGCFVQRVILTQSHCKSINWYVLCDMADQLYIELVLVQFCLPDAGITQFLADLDIRVRGQLKAVIHKRLKEIHISRV